MKIFKNPLYLNRNTETGKHRTKKIYLNRTDLIV
jgi:hypothetical protein